MIVERIPEPEFIQTLTEKMLDIWEDESRWVKETLARSAYGHNVSPEEPEATKWCAVGCAYRALHELGLMNGNSGMVESFLHRATHWLTNGVYGQVTRYNDDRETTFEDMRLLVKRLPDVPLSEIYPPPLYGPAFGDDFHDDNDF